MNDHGEFVIVFCAIAFSGFIVGVALMALLWWLW